MEAAHLLCPRCSPCVPLPHNARSSRSSPRVLDGWWCGMVVGGGGWSMVMWPQSRRKGVENKWGGVKTTPFVSNRSRLSK